MSKTNLPSHFPSHAELLEEMAAGLREHKAKRAKPPIGSYLDICAQVNARRAELSRDTPQLLVNRTYQ